MLKQPDLTQRLSKIEDRVGLEVWEWTDEQGHTHRFKSDDGLRTFVDWTKVVYSQSTGDNTLSMHDVYGVLVQ